MNHLAQGTELKKSCSFFLPEPEIPDYRAPLLDFFHTETFEKNCLMSPCLQRVPNGESPFFFYMNRMDGKKSQRVPPFSAPVRPPSGFLVLLKRILDTLKSFVISEQQAGAPTYAVPGLL